MFLAKCESNSGSEFHFVKLPHDLTVDGQIPHHASVASGAGICPMNRQHNADSYPILGASQGYCLAEALVH